LLPQSQILIQPCPPLNQIWHKQVLKDPYVFDFLTMVEDFQEKDLEKGLIDHMAKFLLELGAGFGYLGRQYPIEAGGKGYSLDLLFYHLKLRCYVVIERG